MLAFLDLAQPNEGHVLVIPRQHRADIRDLDDALGASVMRALTSLSRAITEAFAPDGLTIRHNVGSAGGQDVFHAHFHIYTRMDDDGLQRAYAHAPEHPSRAVLDAIATRIRRHLPEHPERTS